MVVDSTSFQLGRRESKSTAQFDWMTFKRQGKRPTGQQKASAKDLCAEKERMLCSSGQTLACFIFQGDVWICMELMDTSLDKFYKHVIDKGLTIPEDILGKIAVSVSISRVRRAGEGCSSSKPSPA